MSLTQALNNSVRGLQVNQSITQTISSNVVNASVEGYSRKITAQKTLIGQGLGMGTELGELGREVDKALLRDLRMRISSYAQVAVKNEYQTSLQPTLGLFDRDGDLPTLISKFAAAIQDATMDTGALSYRTNIIELGAQLCMSFQTIYKGIQNLRAQADLAIETEVGYLAKTVENLHDVNKKIRTLGSAPGVQLNDFMDERDRLINTIAESINVHVLGRPAGDVVVSAAGGQVLVNLEPVSITYERFLGFMSPAITYPGGGMSPIKIANVDVTTNITSGRLKGLIELRDQILPSLQEEIDTLATYVRDQVNSFHNMGISLTPCSTLTALRSLGANATAAGAATPNWTGTVRIALINAQANFKKVTDIDLSLISTLDDLVTAINTGLGEVAASIDPSGRLVLTSNDGYGIGLGSVQGAAGDPTITITDANGNPKTVGFSHYFGFNDFFASNGSFVGDAVRGVSSLMEVNTGHIVTGSFIGLASLNTTATPAISPLGTAQDQHAFIKGDNSVGRYLAASLQRDSVNLPAAGHFDAQSKTLLEFASDIIAQNSGEADYIQQKEKTELLLKNNTATLLYNKSGVNVDEELQNLMITNQSYKACAKVFRATEDMLEALMNMKR